MVFFVSVVSSIVLFDVDREVALMTRIVNLTCYFALSVLILSDWTTQSVAAATVNSSNVDLEITYSFAEAIFTDSGQPAQDGVDYEFDGEPSHFYDLVQTFIFTQGDGSGSVSGSAAIGGATHDYPNPEPDLSGFDPFSESATLNLSTMGQSSTPGSNGSAAIESGLSFFIANFTEDPSTFETESLTFVFDYSYMFDMTLVEDSPAGGAGNGFIDIDAELIEDSTTTYPDIVNEFFGGPAVIVGQGGAGQIQFVTTPGQDFAEFNIMTNVNSTTLVPELIPEPGTMWLVSVGGLLALLRRRR